MKESDIVPGEQIHGSNAIKCSTPRQDSRLDHAHTLKTPTHQDSENTVDGKIQHLAPARGPRKPRRSADRQVVSRRGTIMSTISTLFPKRVLSAEGPSAHAWASIHGFDKGRDHVGHARNRASISSTRHAQLEHYRNVNHVSAYRSEPSMGRRHAPTRRAGGDGATSPAGGALLECWWQFQWRGCARSNHRDKGT